jgi:hypothetical protein
MGILQCNGNSPVRRIQYNGIYRYVKPFGESADLRKNLLDGMMERGPAPQSAGILSNFPPFV